MILGNDTSHPAAQIGKRRFPTAPIKMGITRRKTIVTPWSVIKKLYNSGDSWQRMDSPDRDSSVLMRMEAVHPEIPIRIPPIR